MTDNDQPSNASLAFYKEFLGLSALVTAWLILLGWAYSETYFRLLGIPLSGSGVAASNVIYYSADVARRSWPYVALTLGFVGIIGLVLAIGLRRGMVKTAALAAALGTVALFAFGGWIGANRARLDLATMRTEGFVGLPRALILLESAPPEGDRRAKALHDSLSVEGCYRILFMGDDMLWAVRHYSGLNKTAVLGLPRGKVSAVRLLGHRPNCS